MIALYHGNLAVRNRSALGQLPLSQLVLPANFRSRAPTSNSVGACFLLIILIIRMLCSIS